MTMTVPLSSARPTSGVAPHDFRALMAGFPTGVGVVTAYQPDGRPIGMTCSSICSVSLTPSPTLLVCLRKGSPTLAALLSSGAFALNLLHEGGRATAELFASGDPDRFDRVAWRSGEGFGGPHLPADSHVTADCEISQYNAIGDHEAVFGKVVAVTAEDAERAPLLYGRRRYAVWPAG
ncbi:NADH-FMN oxidoreductase RutF, flavin reductase (DIM6/NTAB) family [Streptomyces zhaozhouensis]|uniref:NADH-FMN oxidoreductase RutF, flavin reductase (DIM6/NTAB) family n=1 Tax=Streptomyces zhaozhouensis TaxID=1300267 RepID=A0A286DXF9_9ACTN|nr:NADH-FMN oxidoreductase RutF, flavin reductase (DIM6/NTAB) family [Streptomyces zhaozhouensis]